MKRPSVGWGCRLGLSLTLLVLGRSAYGAAPVPNLTARAAVVMDTVTGDLIWARNPDLELPPASTTKVMTATLALESGRLSTYLTVSRYAAAQPPSKIRLFPDQQASLRDLTYAVMLNSANDAAVVIAEGLGGSVEQFAAMMNQRARSLGAVRTWFQNPNGLPDPDHLSTARDLALIFRHALSVRGFREIASTRISEMTVTGAGPRQIMLQTHNRLLGSYVVPVIGKTGYTNAAGRCFVGAAELDGREVIIALLGSSSLWVDVRRLTEFGLGIDARKLAELRIARGGRSVDDEDSSIRSRRLVAKKARLRAKYRAIAKSSGARPTATGVGAVRSGKRKSTRKSTQSAAVEPSAVLEKKLPATSDVNRARGKLPGG